MTQTSEKTFRQKVDQVLAMLKPDFDWDKHYEQDNDGPDDLFRECIAVGWPEGDEAKNYVECGSAEVENTPSALYRLLYLCRPSKVDFSDMYKVHLFGVFSSDKRFLVEVYLFKYEIGLYFYCPRESLAGTGSFVVGGWPGCDNGFRCSDEDGSAFFQMVTQAANYTWPVYPGNNFEV